MSRNLSIQSIQQRFPWIMWPLAFVDALLTPRRWAYGFKRVAAAVSDSLAADSTRLARFLVVCFGWLGSLRAGLIADRPFLMRVAWSIRKFIWSLTWAFIVVMRLWPRKLRVPTDDNVIRLIAAPEGYPDFQSPKLVVPSDVPYADSSQSQGLRVQIANTLGTPVEKVVIRRLEGSGQYGRTTWGGDGAEADAAILSQLVGKPVSVQWTLQEDLAWSTVSPGWVADLKAGLDARGHLIAFESDGYSPHENDARLLGAVLAGMPTVTPRVNTGISTVWPYDKVPNVLEQAYGMTNLGTDAPSEGGIARQHHAHGLAAPVELCVGIADERGRSGGHWAAIADVQVTPGTGQVQVTTFTIGIELGKMMNPRQLKAESFRAWARRSSRRSPSTRGRSPTRAGRATGS